MSRTQCYKQANIGHPRPCDRVGNQTTQPRRTTDQRNLPRCPRRRSDAAQPTFSASRRQVLRHLLAERGHAPVAVQCLAERSYGEFNLGQSEPWSFGDKPANPPRRRPLVPLRVIAVQETEGQSVGEADVLKVSRSGLSDPRVPRRQGVAEAGVGVSLRRHRTHVRTPTRAQRRCRVGDVAIFDVPQRFSQKWVYDKVPTMDSTEFHAMFHEAATRGWDEDELRQLARMWAEESGASRASPG